MLIRDFWRGKEMESDDWENKQREEERTQNTEALGFRLEVAGRTSEYSEGRAARNLV